MKNTKAIDNELLQMLVCPLCRGPLLLEKARLECQQDECDAVYYIDEGIPIMLPEKDLTEDLKTTLAKWSKSYDKVSFEDDWKMDTCLQDSDNFLHKYVDSRSEGIYFEAGCGLAKNALLLACEGITVVGLDLCIGALKKAKKKFEQEGKKGFFVCGDMNKLPFKDKLFSVIYAGGSIEHFTDTLGSVKELKRVLAKKGILVATVPLVSLSTLTYGQLSGNIPDVPLLRQIAEFVHIKLLKKKRMIYGYEKSFTARNICDIFRNAGFNKVEYGPYHTFWEIKFFKSKWIKSLLRKLSRTRLFWPFIYVTGEHK